MAAEPWSINGYGEHEPTRDQAARLRAMAVAVHGRVGRSDFTHPLVLWSQAFKAGAPRPLRDRLGDFLVLFAMTTYRAPHVKQAGLPAEGGSGA